MKITGLFIIGITLGMVSPLGAESAALTRHEKNLAHLQSDRNLDDTHTRAAQEQIRKGTIEMTGHNEQQARDVQQLKSVEKQVAAGREQKQGRHVMAPLLESRRQLKQDIHRGDRQVHNEKTVLRVQQRSADSSARYRAIEDRKIKKAEKIIAQDRSEIAQKTP